MKLNDGNHDHCSNEKYGNFERADESLAIVMAKKRLSMPVQLTVFQAKGARAGLIVIGDCKWPLFFKKKVPRAVDLVWTGA